MLIFIICFLSGDLFLQSFSHLSGGFIIYLLTIVSIVLWIATRNRLRYFLILPAFMLGLSWSYHYAGGLLSWELPDDLEGQKVSVIGTISSLPVVDSRQTNFLFHIKKINHHLLKKKILVRLSWRDDGHDIKVGDRWQLLVKMKRIQGVQNPGTFDYEAWSLQNGIRASGYVSSSTYNCFLSRNYFHHPVDRIRQYLQYQILARLPVSKTSHWLVALMVGERSGIPQGDWAVLRNTGTNHLMAIGGLHIGIISGFAHLLVLWLWRRSTYLMLILPAQHAGAFSSLIAAIIYSALGGFSIPTQRACLMLSVFIAALLSRRKINTWHVWSIAMLMVLIVNPLSVLSESFWLSFGTIALIIYGIGGRSAASGVWWKWGRVQWVIGFGLIPLTLYFFQSCSLISFAANSIAIPWLGMLILPFCFVGGICLIISPDIATIFLLIADKSLSLLWGVLSWLSHLNIAVWQQSIPSYSLLLISIAACIFLLFPSGFPGRWLGLLWMLPLIFYQPDRPLYGEFTLTLLDVGQGLSVIVQTKDHTLVYDAGPRFSENFDMGESVVLPYLRMTGIKNVDMLVVSHGDNDHIGGARALLKSLKVNSILTSVPDKILSSMTQNCIAGQSWRWDGISFSFLYPSRENSMLGNDSSCVLRVDNGIHSVLLTGDIEKYAEKFLVETRIERLPSTILVAPHHGSKTSGVMKFVTAVHPVYVLYATGYRNRYHFPHQSVVDTYTKMNSIQLNTVDSGAIIFNITMDNILASPLLYRNIHHRYWYQ